MLEIVQVVSSIVGSVAVAALLILCAQLAGSQAWLALFPGSPEGRRLAVSYHVSQLGKYVPGGIGQAAGQVALARRAGVTVTTGALNWVVITGFFVVAGFAIGAALAITGDDLPAVARLGAAAGLLTLAAIDRRLLAAVLDRVHRRWPRIPDGSDADARYSTRPVAAWGAHGLPGRILVLVLHPG